MATVNRKFAHHASYIVWGGGKRRCQCCCGKQSPAFKDTDETTAQEQAEAWFVRHTGLLEVKPTKRG